MKGPQHTPVFKNITTYPYILERHNFICEATKENPLASSFIAR